MSFFHTLKQGQRYLKSWPLQPKLGSIFPENRIIKSTLFAQKFMPFMAVFAVVWQQLYARQDTAALAIALLTAIFALMLPMQGLYWLGKRAKSPLSSQTEQVFHQTCQKLKDDADIYITPRETPCYQDLAEVLNKAAKKLGQDFWQEL
ncbi:DUF412 family protein [[Haemophilus] felis]|uniref:UPF0208 membrane protein YfbV n=1 Tax=[Haemophilus] felis TaxID=123822 RepID=A0A1T0AVV6_9PAST|nr:DUF412 family protein [[Haemophilus] felis]NBI41499.1 DUF412 family protein [[Haemophilus] felis]OOS01350.1 hypothetical protein B0188_09760 [[Haemophilus] felis]